MRPGLVDQDIFPFLRGGEKLGNLPALNLAICWKSLFTYLAQSAGNLIDLDQLGLFRDYTPNPIICNIALIYFGFMLPTKALSTQRFEIGSYLEKKNKNKPHNPLFGSYLCGLIEGDGTIIVPKTERSPFGDLYYPSIQIVFDARDLPLAIVIQKELGFGSISKTKGTNSYRLTINNYEGVVTMVELLNGYMRTTKIVMFNRLIDFLNKKFPTLQLSEPFAHPSAGRVGWAAKPQKEVDNSKLDSNA